ERRARGRGHLDRDRLVLRALDRDTVADRVEAGLALVQDPVRDVVAGARRGRRLREMSGGELLADSAVLDLVTRLRQVLLRDDRERVRLLRRLAVVPERERRARLDGRGTR